MNTKSSRGRGAAAFVASLALLGGAASLTTAPASAVPQACDTPFDMDGFADLVGQEVGTFTVVTGTVPVEFTGTVLGKINDGIAPGLDMIMADFENADASSIINKAGIWQGMSGSPVYYNGELVGAVAYGLAWGPSTVAGITPYEDMDDYLGTATVAKVRVSDDVARTIAAATDVTRAQASQGFSQLRMPVGYSGLSQQRLAQMKKKGPDYLHTRGTRAAGASSSAVDAGPEDLVPGGNLGAAISYGDITAGGVGTVTSVCDDRLVGFGHPMTYGGETSLGMMPAESVYIQADPVAPGFKVANMGDPAGTIDQDRLTGISGTIGVLPPETDVTSTVTYGARERTGTSHSLAPDYNADITFSQILANHDRVVDAVQPGSEVATFSITGTDAEGTPFAVDFSERYTSEYDISFESIWDVADIVWSLTRMEDVTIDGVTATADVSDEASQYRVKGLEQKRGGSWHVVNRRHPAITTAGGVLTLRATLSSVANGTTTVPLTVEVPGNARRSGFLAVQGGASTYSDAIYRADTPAEMEEAVATLVRNDQVAAFTYFRRGDGDTAAAVSEPTDLVVRGRKYGEIVVRR